RRTVMPLQGLPFLVRLINAMSSYVRYIWKALWPRHLFLPYTYAQGWSLLFVLLLAFVLVSFSLFALSHGRRKLYVIVGWLWFMGILVPTIGFVQVGIQSMADRYSYVPLIGLFLIAVWGANDLAQQWRMKPPAVGFLAIAVIAAYSIAT